MLLWNIFSDLTLKRKANKHIIHQNINLSFRNIFRHVDIYTQPIAMHLGVDMVRQFAEVQTESDQNGE